MLDFLYHPVVLILIAVLSVARMTRFVTFDDWPPMEWARPRIAAKLRGWDKLTVCPFCAAPYLVAGQMVWFWLTYREGGDVFLWGWLLPNLWWAVSYVAAMVVAYDMPEE